jgi:hypothetical protein
MRTRLAFVSLVLLALVQVAVLGRKAVARPAPVGPPVFLAVDDTVPQLRVRHEDGTRAAHRFASGAGRWTVVLSFRSDCKPSQAVVPAWTAWLNTRHPVDVVAVTRDSLPVATTYRDARRWPVRVISLERPRRGTPEHALVTRTPWIFLLDPSGVVRYEGHGGTLPVVDSLIARHVAASSAAGE